MNDEYKWIQVEIQIDYDQKNIREVDTVWSSETV